MDTSEIDTDKIDLERAIKKLPAKAQLVMQTALRNGNRHDLGFTEKEWRYWHQVGIDLLKESLT